METVFKKVTRIGDQCYNVFVARNGAEVIVPIAKAEYKALALVGAIQPTRKNCKWAYSLETPLFDTPTGFLEANQYADLDSEQIIINAGKKRRFELPITRKEYILDNTITPKGRVALEAEYKVTFK